MDDYENPDFPKSHWQFHQEPTTAASRYVYLYLRSAVQLEYADDAIAALAEAYPYRVCVLEMPPDGGQWENGFALQFLTPMRIPDLVARLQPGLAGFDAWAAFDVRGEYKESETGGLLSRYFERATGGRFAQLFIMGERDTTRYSKAIERVQDSVKSLCLPVFYFRDGEVRLLDSRERSSVTNQRCKTVSPSFSGWCVVDSSEDILPTETPEGRCWVNCLIRELAWGNDGNG